MLSLRGVSLSLRGGRRLYTQIPVLSLRGGKPKPKGGEEVVYPDSGVKP